MDISSYLKRRKITQAAFAAIIGCHPSTVGRWIKGEPPDWPTMAKVFEATSGKVRPDDFAPFLAARNGR